MDHSAAFSGRARRKETGWRVRVMDVVSRWVITVGGIGTVVAVSTVFLLLLWVAFPLLLPSRVTAPGRFPVAAGSPVLRTGVDESRSIVWVFRADGTLSARTFGTGALLEEQRLFPGRTITASAFTADGTGAALGFADGTIALGSIGFASSFVDAAAAPQELLQLGVGGQTVAGPAVAQRISPSQFRLQRLDTAFAEPVPGASAAAVRLLDRSGTGSDGAFVALHGDGAALIVRMTQRQNILTGEVVSNRETIGLPSSPPGAPPAWLLLSDRGDSALLAWPSGRAYRHVVRDPAAPPETEQVSLLGERGGNLTVVRWLLGRTSILAGDASGRVDVWFPVHQAGGQGGATLALAHSFPGARAGVTAIAASPRSRLFAAGFADGTVEVRHATSHKLLARLTAAAGKPVETLALAPKDDGIVAIAGGNLAHWVLDPGHPETTLRSLFGRVWYEGAARPEHVWQSSAATDDFEPKLGLVPLVFGTLKATTYSLLFGVPLALLAAIFTSEFLSPRARMGIKPVVELMASLPSVVLGFLAALVIAPFVAGRLTSFLTLMILGPAVFLGGAYLWQFIPYRSALRLQRWRFPAMFLAVPAALLLARALGPAVERLCFGGDIAGWLNGGRAGGTAGGWAFLLLGPAVVVVVLLFGRHVTPRLLQAARGWTRARCAAADFARFGLILLGSLALAAAAGSLLAALGLDPRGPLVGTYVQRNSLVVGFVMGFAIIPIIYTIAEDALAAVPDHLRSASLAAGATLWQTAWRIVIPTATSGLFSAVMIGLGRAVGETMIVLMAAGNTPILDWNVFNGFRTLSANIAVELPEAVRNSTHYRTLFLSALVLFLMTFVLNTCAEIVRIRFRKKAQEL